MLADRDKISIRQAIFIFLTIIYTPAIRIMPVYAARKADHAAWLAAVVPSLLLVLLVLIWQSIYKRYKDNSLMDIYGKMTGKITGKILAAAYLLWMMLLSALYLRYFAIRLVASAYPNVNMSIFIISLLLVISFTIRNGIPTLARYNEVIFPILAGLFFLLVVLMIPNIRWEFLTPLTYRNILPVMNAGIAVIGHMVYFSFIFIIGDRINNKEKIKKPGIQASIFLLIAITLLFVTTIGSLSYTVVRRAQLPFLTAVKQISIVNTLDKIESVVVAFWIVSDFVLISFFIVCTLHIMKSLFNIKSIKSFINIYIIFTYFLCLFLANNSFELQHFSEYFISPGNIVMGYIIPVIIFFIGKVRKKV